MPNRCFQHASKHISVTTKSDWVGKHDTSGELGPQNAQRPFFEILQLEAKEIELAHSLHHLATVNQLLQEAGVLKINMGFRDPTSKYLKQLIIGLHKYHGHGLPINHSVTRGWFWDVKPTQAEAPSYRQQHIARSETMESFPWHTDCSYEHCPPRFFALQVLEHDKNGGGTLSVLPVARLLETVSATTIDRLCRPEYLIRVPPEFIKNADEVKITAPVLSRDRSEGASRWQQPQSFLSIADSRRRKTKPNFHLRFRADIIEPLTATAAEALGELRSRLSEIRRSNVGVVHLTSDLLPSGSILLVNNGSWLHARNNVKDMNRHLRRVRWDARPLSL